jgi:hypothetical protein
MENRNVFIKIVWGQYSICGKDIDLAQMVAFGQECYNILSFQWQQHHINHPFYIQL